MPHDHTDWAEREHRAGPALSRERDVLTSGRVGEGINAHEGNGVGQRREPEHGVRDGALRRGGGAAVPPVRNAPRLLRTR